jgi:uncharacterized pyridoxal phosphate-containing UPF0001 family protein
MSEVTFTGNDGEALKLRSEAAKLQANLDASARLVGRGALTPRAYAIMESEGLPQIRKLTKAADAVALFDVIETVDRPKLARVLADEMAKAGKTPRLYVQVNTGEEPQKAGVIPPQADAFIAQCRGEYGLTLEGLMCIPPQDEPPGPHFALLAKIAERNGLHKLSMGMSADFETAIRFGATSVRVGSALFGDR